MDNIAEFEYRSNVNHFNVLNHKDVILYDDHRTLFAILFDLRKYNLVADKPNLIYFDYHDDCVVPQRMPVDNRLSLFGNREIADIESSEIWTYGEFRLATNDDDWLTAAMDLDLINDAVVIGVQRDNNINSLNNRYANAEIRHHLYKMGHLDDEIGNRGILGDLMRQDEDSLYLRKIFEYNSDETIERPFILDFDLDCFSTDCCDRTIAWPHKIFCEKYVCNTQVKELMMHMIQSASLITICREPGCCGGLGESNKILAYIDEYFLDGGLKTQPIV